METVQHIAVVWKMFLHYCTGTITNRILYMILDQKPGYILSQTLDCAAGYATQTKKYILGQRSTNVCLSTYIYSLKGSLTHSLT